MIWTICHSLPQSQPPLSKLTHLHLQSVSEEQSSHSCAKVAGTTELFGKAVELLPEPSSLACEGWFAFFKKELLNYVPVVLLNLEIVLRLILH